MTDVMSSDHAFASQVRKVLRVAAVQVQSRSGSALANLARAEPLVARAAAEGARLLLCPEFLAAGYVYDETVWKSAERRGGVTEAWLSRQAIAHDVYVGATYLEAESDDFYNTFALAAPDGGIIGRVRKESLPGFEGWYFKSCEQAKFIDTELGRIGVGICQDNHTARFFRRVLHEQPDLILMPHSTPCMTLGTALTRECLSEITRFYASEFGVPVVLVNKACTRERSPLPGVPLLRLRFDFQGLSSISDSDGRMLTQLPDREDVAIADVCMDPARKRRPQAPTDPYWSRRPDRFPTLLGAMFRVFERLGERAYARNPARPVAARSCSER